MIISIKKFKLITENIENSTYDELEKIVSYVLSEHYVEYVTQFKKEEDTNNESTTYEFTLVIPKGDEMINNFDTAPDVENMFEQQYGRGSSNGPGQSFTKIYYNAIDTDNTITIHIMYQYGYDV